MAEIKQFNNGDYLTTEYLQKNALALANCQRQLITHTEYPLKIVGNTILFQGQTPQQIKSVFWAKITGSEDIGDFFIYDWTEQQRQSDGTFADLTNGRAGTTADSTFGMASADNAKQVADDTIVLMLETLDETGAKAYTFVVAGSIPDGTAEWDLLRWNNTTKVYVLLPKGSSYQALQTKADGTVAYDYIRYT